MQKYIALMGLFLCLSNISYGQNFITEALEKWDNSQTYFNEIVQLISEDMLDYQPTEATMSLRAQLIHSGSNMVRLSNAYLSYSDIEVIEKPVATADLESIKDYLSQCFLFARSAIAAQNEESLNIEVPHFFAGSKSRRQIIWLINDHLAHHRGQILVYLRLKNINPPKYVGW